MQIQNYGVSTAIIANDQEDGVENLKKISKDIVQYILSYTDENDRKNFRLVNTFCMKIIENFRKIEKEKSDRLIESNAKSVKDIWEKYFAKQKFDHDDIISRLKKLKLRPEEMEYLINAMVEITKKDDFECCLGYIKEREKLDSYFEENTFFNSGGGSSIELLNEINYHENRMKAKKYLEKKANIEFDTLDLLLGLAAIHIFRVKKNYEQGSFFAGLIQDEDVKNIALVSMGFLSENKELFGQIVKKINIPPVD